MCLAPTHHVTKVRPSIDSPHRVVIPRITPEYQYPWFRFYCDASWGDTRQGGRPSIPPSATVLAAVTVAAASPEANTCPPSSVSVDVTATAVTMAADVE
jgi:hypothetical protein